MAELPKLIATDIDGTIFTKQKKVLPYTYEVLTNCIKKGSFLVPVTGRVLSMVPLEKFPEVRYVISSNGALITDRKDDKVLRVKYIRKTDLQKFWMETKGIIREYSMGMEIFENDQLVVEQQLFDNLPFYRDVFPDFHYEQIKNGNAKIVSSYDDYFEKEGEQVVKVNFPGKACKKFPFIKDLVRESGILTITSDGANMECGPKGCNKGEAILWLCDYLNIPRESTLAFGDASNDLEFLTVVHYGVAMGNALDSVKEVAPYTTLSNEEDGIAYFIEKTFLKN